MNVAGSDCFLIKGVDLLIDDNEVEDDEVEESRGMDRVRVGEREGKRAGKDGERAREIRRSGEG